MHKFQAHADLLPRANCMEVQNRCSIHSSIYTLQETTTRVILHMLMNVISEIRSSKEITSEYSEYFDFVFSIYGVREKICSCLLMHEMYWLAKLSSTTKLNLKIYLKKEFEQYMRYNQSSDENCISFHQLVGIDPIHSCVADLKAMEISCRREDFLYTATHAFHFMSFFAEIVANILAEQYSQEKRTAFMKALDNYDVENRPMATCASWNECSKDMSLIYRGPHCYLPLCYNNQFLIAQKIDKEKESKLNKKYNTFLQISFHNMLNLDGRYLHEKLTYGNYHGSDRWPRKCFPHLCSAMPYESISEILLKENERLSEFFFKLKNIVMNALRNECLVVFIYRALEDEGAIRNARALGFFDRKAFVYVFINKEYEIEEFFAKRKHELQNKPLHDLFYKGCTISSVEYTQFLPRDILKGRKGICACLLRFDDYDHHVYPFYNEPPAQLTPLSLFFNSTEDTLQYLEDQQILQLH